VLLGSASKHIGLIIYHYIVINLLQWAVCMLLLTHICIIP